MRHRLAIVVFDNLLREHRNASIRDVFEVERGLLVLHERTVKPASCALMSRIGTGHSKSTHQRRLISGYLAARWFCNAAVQTTAAHLKVLSGPVVGKGDSEAD